MITSHLGDSDFVDANIDAHGWCQRRHDAKTFPRGSLTLVQGLVVHQLALELIPPT
jgi:hypothetical protein